MIRAQVDFAIALRDPIKSNHKRLHDMFFGVFDTQTSFSNAFSRLTDNFGAIVTHTRARSSTITRCIFQYRAREPEDENYRLCSARVWAIDRAHRLLQRLKKLEYEVRIQKMLDRGAVIV
jgi:hypothetical protein